LCSELGLPAGEDYTQDWASELPEKYRTSAWLDRYLAALGQSEAVEVRRLLMELVLDVANDLATSTELTVLQMGQVERELVRSPSLYQGLVDYWACPGEPLSNCFEITPWIRRQQDSMV